MPVNVGLQEGGVLLVATTRDNVSPSLVLELLRRVGGIIKVRQLSGLALSYQPVHGSFLPIHLPVLTELDSIASLMSCTYLMRLNIALLD